MISQVIIIKDGNGNIFWPQYYVNNIGNILIGDGYQVKMLSSQTLEISGSVIIPEITPVTIPSGWSILGYLRETPASVITLMNSVVSNVIIMKDGDGNIYWPQYLVNNIGNMQPGKGYQIKTNALCILIYPANSLNIEKSEVIIPEPQHFGKPLNTGNNMTLGIINDELDILDGEIGVFDSNDLLVGSAIVDSDFTAITIWGDDESTPEKDGLNTGESFIIKFWNKQTSEVELVNITEWVEGNGYYQPNGISIACKAEMFSATHPELFQNIPNPFNGFTEIGFNLPTNNDAELTVFNAIGEKIAILCNGSLPSGKHSFRFYSDDYSSGVYFYKLKANNYTETKAMNISK
ncbi:MAG: T9SS type A sorting domain-containing protein [Bacteroidia bacterium]|nr:T9SS type A sorting domain-containing protein [Bacteroidia bacterium]